MDNRVIWQQVLENINSVLDTLSFNTWFKGIDFIDIKDNSIRIMIPMSFYKTHIEQNYKNIILKNFNEILGTNYDGIIYILKDNMNDILNEKEEKIVINNVVDNYDKDYKSNLNKNYTFEKKHKRNSILSH